MEVDLDTPRQCLPSLRQLPKITSLESLKLALWASKPEEIQQIMGAVAAATQLQSVCLYNRDRNMTLEPEDRSKEDIDEDGPIGLGDVKLSGRLCKLPQLEQLQLHCLHLNSGMQRIIAVYSAPAHSTRQIATSSVLYARSCPVCGAALLFRYKPAAVDEKITVKSFKRRHFGTINLCCQHM